MHGGKIGVRSLGKEGAGSTFYFTLPVMAHLPDLDVSKTLAPEQTIVILTEQSGHGNNLRHYLVRQGFEIEVLSLDRTADWSSRWLASPPGAVILER